jgi:hypothetical protein
MESKCKDCVWYSPALFACFHRDNEGRRVFDDSTACNNIKHKGSYEKETSYLP